MVNTTASAPDSKTLDEGATDSTPSYPLGDDLFFGEPAERIPTEGRGLKKYREEMKNGRLENEILRTKPHGSVRAGKIKDTIRT